MDQASLTQNGTPFASSCDCTNSDQGPPLTRDAAECPSGTIARSRRSDTTSGRASMDSHHPAVVGRSSCHSAGRRSEADSLPPPERPGKTNSTIVREDASCLYGRSLSGFPSLGHTPRSAPHTYEHDDCEPSSLSPGAGTFRGTLCRHNAGTIVWSSIVSLAHIGAALALIAAWVLLIIGFLRTAGVADSRRKPRDAQTRTRPFSR